MGMLALIRFWEIGEIGEIEGIQKGYRDSHPNHRSGTARGRPMACRRALHVRSARCDTLERQIACAKSDRVTGTCEVIKRNLNAITDNNRFTYVSNITIVNCFTRSCPHIPDEEPP
jgi:hypothetical protein